MEKVTIPVKIRENSGSRSSRALRREGYVPGVIYGHGEKTIAFTIPLKTLEDQIRHNVRVITLDFGEFKDQAIIKGLQMDSFGDDILHIDLLRVRMDEVISMRVSLESSGRAKGLDEGGILQTQRPDVLLKCRPDQIPDSIIYDVSDLVVGQSLSLKDLVLPEGVILDDDPEQTIVILTSRIEIVEDEVSETEGEDEEAVEGEDKPADGADKDDKKDKKE